MFLGLMFLLGQIDANNLFDVQANVTEKEAQEALQFRENPLKSTSFKVTPKVDVISGTYIEEAADLVVAGRANINQTFLLSYRSS